MNPPILTVKSVFDQAHEITSADERRAFLDTLCAGNPVLRQQVEALLQAYDAIRSGTFLQAAAGGLGSTGHYRQGPDTPADASVDAYVTMSPQPDTQWESQIEGLGSQIGPYRLIKELGEGGMGAVYLAEQEKPIRRQVALKIIKPGMDSAQIVARFEAERQALTMMDHVNIARVYEAGTTATGRPYFVMELVGGAPMTHFCDQNRLTIRERLHLFATVCEAIQHAHAKGVMHRDIKPGNVLVAMQDDKPVPKVIDFGLAKAMGKSLTDETRLTQVGAIVGTLEYMSPEQADPSGPAVDTAADVYSLGVMLYELLTGTTPLDVAGTPGAGGFMDLVVRIHTEDAPRPSARVAGLGKRLPAIAEQRKTEPAKLVNLLRGELDWIAMKALEKDRTRRYDTASGFAKDVQRYLNDEPVEACPPTVGYRVGKFVRKNRGVLASVLFIIALLLVGSVVSTSLAVRAMAAERTALAAQQEMREGYDLADATVMVASRNVANLNPLDKRVLHTALSNLPSHEPRDSRESRAIAASRQLLVANIHFFLGDYGQAEQHFRQAIQLNERLANDFPAVIQYPAEQARSYFALAYVLQRVEKRRPDAEAALNRAVDLHLKLIDDFPNEVDKWRSQADQYNNTGVVLFARKDLKMAENFYRAAITLGEKIADLEPGVAQYRVNLAYSYHNLANALRDQGSVKDALTWYQKAAKTLNAIIPRPPDATLALRYACWDTANALGQLGRHAKAIQFWRNAITLDDGTDGDKLRLFLAAEQIEEKLKAGPRPAGDVLYEAARACARAKEAAARAKEPTLEERYTRRTLDLLKQAQSTGWFGDPLRVKQIKEEKSFTALPRDEFKRFLDSLATKTGTKDRLGKE